MPEHFSFRWGIPILEKLGHTTIYNFLLDHYSQLGVSPLEMMFIIHLSQFRYESPQGRANPALITVAELMGYKDEQPVRRLKKSLKDKKLLTVKDDLGKPSTYDFTAFAKKAFALWQAEHDNDEDEPDGSITPQTNGTPIQIDRGIQTDRGRGIQPDRGSTPTPIRSDRGPLYDQIPEEERKNHDGVGDACTLEKTLLGHEMYPATVRQILALNLDAPTVIASVEHLLSSGWGIGAIADRLRRSPPDKGHPYERQPARPVQSDVSPHRPKRATGKHNGTGGAELKDPGWKQREIARIQREYGISDADV